MSTTQDPQNVQEVLEEIENQIPVENTDPTTDDDQLIALQKQVESLQSALARSQADYQNLVMRNERDKADMVHFLSVKIMLPLLTQYDHLERAIGLKSGVEGDAFIDGIRAVASGFQKYLDSQKVTAFASIGATVDPDRHDVMTEMPGDE
jgi:molecular chaperone GrpE